jgi:branched-chain amino acid transport system substrate-binding protein
VIYFGGYHTEIGLIGRQAREQGLKATLIGPDSLTAKEFWQISGSAGEGLMFTFPSDPRARATAAAVVKEFKDKGIDPEGYVLYTYAAIQLWAEVATKINSIDPKKVAEAIKSGGPWPTVLGDMSFDKKGDVTVADYVWYVWHDGNYSQM